MVVEEDVENEVFIKNGKIKTILNEETQLRGWMTVNECFRLVRTGIMQMDKSMKDESNN